MPMNTRLCWLTPLLLGFPHKGWAGQAPHLDLTDHWIGFVALAIFAIAYIFVILEESCIWLSLNPSSLAGLIGGLIAFVYNKI